MIPTQINKYAARGIEILLVPLQQALQHCNTTAIIIAESLGSLGIEFPVLTPRGPNYTGISQPFIKVKIRN